MQVNKQAARTLLWRCAKCPLLLNRDETPLVE